MAYKDNNFSSPYALKVLKAETTRQRRRFKREIKAMQTLEHSNIVRVYDAFIEENTCYMVMDYIEGLTLEDIIKDNQLMLKEKINIIRQAARGVEALHAKNIHHRDIKPANILVTSNQRVYITDFGIAKCIGHEESMKLTKTGAILGTPSYLSPEQAEGKVEHIDHRSDIYSLGATFYELLVNKKPVMGENTYEILLNIVSEPIRPLREYDESIPEDVELICLKALHKDYRRRYSSCKEFIKDLDLFTDGYKPKASQEESKMLFELFSKSKNRSLLLCSLSAISYMCLFGTYYAYKQELLETSTLEKQFDEFNQTLGIKEEEMHTTYSEKIFEYNMLYNITKLENKEIQEILKKEGLATDNSNDIDKIVFCYDSLLEKEIEEDSYLNILDKKFNYLVSCYKVSSNNSEIYEHILNVCFSSPNIYYALKCYKEIGSLATPQKPYDIFHVSLQYFNEAINEFPNSGKNKKNYILHLRKSRKKLMDSFRNRKTGYEYMLLTNINYRIFDFYAYQSREVRLKVIFKLAEMSHRFANEHAASQGCLKDLYTIINGNLIMSIKENIMHIDTKAYEESIKKSLFAFGNIPYQYYFVSNDLKKNYFVFNAKINTGLVLGDGGLIYENHLKEKFDSYFSKNVVSSYKIQSYYEIARIKPLTEMRGSIIFKENLNSEVLRSLKQYSLTVQNMVKDCDQYYDELVNKLKKDTFGSIERLQIHEEATILYNTLDNCIRDEAQLTNHYNTDVLSHDQREEIYILQKKLINLEVRYGGKSIIRYKQVKGTGGEQ